MQLHLKNQYDQINSECDNISVKRKQVEQKIRDRQYEKSKLQSQLSNRIFHHDNNKLYSHLEKQINSSTNINIYDNRDYNLIDVLSTQRQCIP